VRRRTRWIVGICALLVVGAGVFRATSGHVHGLGDVHSALSLQVVDARTGKPIRGAEVFVGHALEVHDPAWREQARASELAPFRCPRCYARTDAAGFVVVETVTTLCTSYTTWQELTDTVPDRMSSWSGVSLWVVAPAYLPHVADGLKSPRRERPRADGVPGTVFVLDLGTVALEPEGP
jgi:hypothetical protein